MTHVDDIQKSARSLILRDMDGNHTYRPDIDGLRAIAVIAVVLFHAFPYVMPGGFVGVDIFFVISGFLITGIIIKDLRRDQFSFYDFWTRRIRRIFPAVLTVLSAVFVGGWFYLFPSEFKELKSHILWALSFAANFKIRSDTGYFNTDAALKPLLHFWSLAIEEQFYLCWPCVLFWCHRKNINLLIFTFALAILSFCSSYFYQPSMAFYLPWTRFWELSVGGMIALASHGCGEPNMGGTDTPQWGGSTAMGVKNGLRRPTLMLLGNLSSGCGLILIAYCCFNFSDATPFPGASTLIPVFGTALLIVGGKYGWINRNILALRPLVFVGLISFPLYLWHWPLLSFLRIVKVRPSDQLLLISMGISLLLAIFTYYGIEKFLRLDLGRVKWRAPALVGVLISALIFVKVNQIHVYAEKFGISTIDTAITSWAYPGYTMTQRTFFNGLKGNVVHTKVDRYVLFIGDSHMEQYGPRIEKVSEEKPESTLSSIWITNSGCLFIDGFFHPIYQECAERRPKLFELIHQAGKYNIDRIVLTFSFFEHLGECTNKQFDPGGKLLEGKEKKDARLDGFANLLTILQRSGTQVYVLLDIPCGDEFAPRSMLKRSLRGGLEDHAASISKAEAKFNRGIDIDSFIINEAKRRNFIVIDPIEFLCSKGRCDVRDVDGRPIYRDRTHITSYAARDLLKYIDQTVQISSL